MRGLSKRRIALMGGVVLATAMLAPAVAQAATGDLAVEKSDDPDPVREGQVLTYTITVDNAGPEAVSGVTLVDELPNQVDFISAEASVGTCDRSGHRVTCELGMLETGAGGPEATVTIRVRPTKPGTITNEATAEVGPTDTDPNPANNTVTENTTVQEAAGGGGGGPQCAGARATIVGTSAGEVLVGGPGRDVIKARGGHDRIRGLGGDDIVCAGGGNDRVRGNAGNDLLKGGRGRDRLRGGGDDDVLAGGPGRDRCRGGAGQDTKRSC